MSTDAIILGTHSTDGKKPPLAVTNVAVKTDSSVVLNLHIDDPELVLELMKYDEGRPRNSFAESAMRIGILALRQAQGQVDATTLRNEGDHLLSEFKHELESRIAEIDTKLAFTLRQYFDPQSGHFTERVERLVKKDGDLERILRNQIGDAERSELARALAKRIGDNSPLMRRLNPHDAECITKSIEVSVKEVLDSEETDILNEFSLDNPNGVLTRVVAQIAENNGKLKGDIEEQITEAVKQFSLDSEESALSRLVRKVEEARKKITDEFSEDNENSAIRKLSSVLSETKNSIEENLTLDNDHSALSRLKRQLNEVLDEIRVKNERFQADVSAKLATLITKRQQAQRSTQHGNDFELEVCSFVQEEAQKAGDIFTATGGRAGSIPRCKKGDGVIEVGSESLAAGAKVVIEAKDSKSYTLADARAEVDEARKNRNAVVGIFVFAKATAPEGLQPFTRLDNDLFVVWDAADPSTDVYLSAAVSVGKAMVFREKLSENKNDNSVTKIEKSVNTIEKQLVALDEVEKWTNTIQANSGKIIKEITKLRTGAAEQIEALRTCVQGLKADN